MLVKSSKNRHEIKKYLSSLDEDDLIENVIIPLYSSFGYTLLRVVTHGPGEHGKDLVVYKHSPAIFGNEYIAIQAKAQKVDAKNVAEMANQLIRALRTPIKGLSGGSEYLPNYVIHFNSQTITNDAHWEFPYLVDGKDNIKIISQDNIVDLMLNNDVVPKSLSSQLETASAGSNDSICKKIQQTLFSGNVLDIDSVFENVIPISKSVLDQETKHMIIEFIFKKWREDKSWNATVKPMKWLEICFDFMSSDQFMYLSDVIDEYISSYPSFEAQEYVQKIVNKITVNHYLSMKKEFLDRTVREFNRGSSQNLKSMFLDFVSKESESQLEKEERDLKILFEKFDLLNKRNLTEEEKNERNEVRHKLFVMQYGDES